MASRIRKTKSLFLIATAGATLALGLASKSPTPGGTDRERPLAIHGPGTPNLGLDLVEQAKMRKQRSESPASSTIGREAEAEARPPRLHRTPPQSLATRLAPGQHKLILAAYYSSHFAVLLDNRVVVKIPIAIALLPLDGCNLAWSVVHGGTRFHWRNLQPLVVLNDPQAPLSIPDVLPDTILTVPTPLQASAGNPPEIPNDPFPFPPPLTIPNTVTATTSRTIETWVTSLANPSDSHRYVDIPKLEIPPPIAIPSRFDLTESLGLDGTGVTDSKVEAATPYSQFRTPLAIPDVLPEVIPTDSGVQKTSADAPKPVVVPTSPQ